MKEDVMSGTIPRMAAAGLVTLLVVLTAGLGILPGSPFGPVTAEARYADWPNTEKIEDSPCVGNSQCFDCDTLQGVTACTTNYPAFGWKSTTCSPPHPGMSGPCYTTNYSCGPLIECISGDPISDGCYSGAWCSRNP